jgi:hypothetical protein
MSALECVRETLRLGLEALEKELGAAERPEFWPQLWERYVENKLDFGRQLSSVLDQSALYGGPAANQPTGLINTLGVNHGVTIDPANLHPSFCAVEELVETTGVSMDSYGVIVSPDTKKILRSTPSFATVGLWLLRKTMTPLTGC